MRLSLLVKNVAGIKAVEGDDPDIKGLAHDSRLVKRGFLFALLPSASGKFPDQAAYVKQALARGAAALLAGSGAGIKAKVPRLAAKDPREAWAGICDAFYGHPSRGLALVGVTGTSGKTTVTFLLRSILERAGRPCAVLGTVGYFVGGKTLEAPNTTPSALEIQGLLRKALKAGDKAAVMEVSSHALDQRRASSLDFDAAVFTNLTRDHLDYHRTMARYLKAKARLFESLGQGSKKKAAAILNLDDAAGNKLLHRVPKGINVLFYGIQNPGARVRASSLCLGGTGSRFRLVLPRGGGPVNLPLPGRFNVSNALAAAAAAWALGCDARDITQGLNHPLVPPGRMEKVDLGQAFQVIVDYAHKPDALERALQSLRECARGRVITVFGCGGDRDKGKRPQMGAIAYRLSDLVLVTSDNPRGEDPEAIIRDILKGVPDERGQVRRVLSLADREQAIARAIKLARPGDIVFLAGKGHETYQIVGEKKIHFDDREMAKRYILKYS